MKIMHHIGISTTDEYLISAYLLLLAPGLDDLGSQHQPGRVLRALVHLSKTTPSGGEAEMTSIRPTVYNLMHIFEVCNHGEMKQCEGCRTL